jgi:hypothetical protein
MVLHRFVVNKTCVIVIVNGGASRPLLLTERRAC